MLLLLLLVVGPSLTHPTHMPPSTPPRNPRLINSKIHQTALDLSTPFRFTGVPNNATVDLVERVRPSVLAFVRFVFVYMCVCMDAPISLIVPLHAPPPHKHTQSPAAGGGGIGSSSGSGGGGLSISGSSSGGGMVKVALQAPGGERLMGSFESGGTTLAGVIGGWV